MEQGRYGHPAKKATWLLAHVADPAALPSLRWGSVPDTESRALVSWCRNHTRADETRPRVGKAVASRTPDDFAALLLELARASVGSGRVTAPRGAEEIER